MKNSYKYLFILLTVFAFNSCAESELSFLESAEDLGFTGSEEDIIDFFSQEAYNGLLELGIPLNTGGNPPNVEGAYLLSPYVLEATNIENDGFPIGQVFSDLLIYFSNQNFDESSINYYEEAINDEGIVFASASGVGSVISGNGNEFTIFIKVEGSTQDSEGNSITFTQAVAISGSLTNGNIQNAEKAFVILNISGDVNDEFIEVGQGRLIVDDDGISEAF